MNASEIELVWVCQRPDSMRSKGLFNGDNPLDYATSTVLAQLSLSSLLSVLIQYILSPVCESSFISMLLVGFILGPTLWGDYHSFLSSVYSKKNVHISEAFAFFGSALHIFVIGIKMDLGMVKRAEKKPVVIGFLTFLFPVTLNLIVAEILTTKKEMGQALHNSVYYIAVFQSVTTFHVIVCLLADLKLLNSEVGQLAISSSMISGTFSWGLVVWVLVIRRRLEHNLVLMLGVFCSLLTVIFILFASRPLIVSMIGKTSNGKPVKEEYIFSIFIMPLGTSFVSEILGYHLLLGAAGLGMVVPHGSPLGSALVNKIKSFVSCILMPSYHSASPSCHPVKRRERRNIFLH